MNRMIARLTFALLAGTAIVTSGSADAGTYSLVYSFSGGGSGDGAAPLAGLLSVPGTSGAMLYGTTVFGGTGGCHLLGFSGCGTVFNWDTAGSAESVVHSFTGTDGFQPSAALISVGGNLYGTAGFGGPCGCGVVFRTDPSTGTTTAVHAFTSGGDGAYPFASLTNVSGKLYGTTQYGGASNDGTIYSYDTSSGVEAVEYSFAGGSDGAQSIAGLTSIGGKLYGTTLQGGASGDGTVFVFDPATGVETVLHSFAGGSSDGMHPYAGVVAIGNTLYGATKGGGGTGCGGTGCGVVFSYNLTTGTESVVHAFSGPDGANPLASLVYAGGTLYGTTVSGGIGVSGSTYGTIYAINPITGAETVLHSFGSGSDGRAPRTTLVNVGGTLYGTTACGGTGGTATSCSGDPGFGTVFAYTP